MSILLLLGDTDTNPRSLFANNEPGAWYDPAGNEGASEAKRAWRRNLLGYTDEFDNAYWTKTNSSVTANATTSFNGNTTADLFIAAASSSSHRLDKNTITVVPNSPYTLSVYAKAQDNVFVYLNIVNPTIADYYCWFDLSNGTLGTTAAGATTNITNVGNGWYRCSITITTTSTQTTANIQIGVSAANGVAIFVGNGTGGIFIDHAQFELGSTPSEYQRITNFSDDFLAAYPTHSLYTNTTGTSPAVYPGDLVALQIDQSRGGLGRLGPDLVVNGTFAADATWSKGANWSIGSGVATKTGGAANNLTQTISSTAGQWYCVTMDVTRTAGTLTASLGTSGTSFSTSETGSYKFYILAGSSTQTLTLAGDSSFAGTVDNVTARLIPGTHRYATTDANRLKLARIPEGGRRNLLTYTEQFDNAAWVKSGTTISANSTTAPDGTVTADSLIENSAAGAHDCVQSFTFISGTQYTSSIWAKANTRTLISFRNDNDNSTVLVNLSTGATSSATNCTATSVDVGNGWWRISMVFTATTTASRTANVVRLRDGSGATSYTGDGTSGIFIWGAQLETGSTATAYQRVTLTEDVTETGKRDCWGLWYQGSQSMITPSVDFSGTAQMTVIAGVRKLSDAAIGVVVELSVSSGSINGSFMLTASGQVSPIAAYGSTLRGNALIYSESPTSYAAPISNVVSLLSDISQSTAADEQQMRINGTQVALATVGSNAGTGNFRNDILYIGRRAGTSNPFNGYDFGIIIRGAQTNDSTIRAIEKWMARRAGITI